MVSETKKQFVQRLVQEIEHSPIVGLVNMQNLPAPQLQTMRTTLRAKKVTIVMARKKLLQRALQQSTKKNIQQLAEQLKGMPALLFSQDNPFTLYSIIQKNKSEAPAKAGQIAPKDIVVKAGPTSFAPGPIISELAAVGIKTKVDQGKLSILQDAVIVKEGQTISGKVAETLKRLDIRPMQIGLDLVAVWENGFLFGAKQLHIDEAEYELNFTTAAQWAINLAVEAVYFTSETTEMLLQKAFREAKALALEQDILTDLTAGEVLAKAESQALSLKEEAHLEIPDKPVRPLEPSPSTAPLPSTFASSPKGNLPSPLKDVHAYVEHDPHSKSHPKQGNVTQDEAQDLLNKLQKEGTLRGTK